MLFRSGLGWSTWDYTALDEPEWTVDGELRVTATVRNAGTRDARETVQLYLEPPAEAAIERPVRWLAGFANVDVAAGESRRVVVTIPRRAFDAWDTAQDRWTTVPGSYRVAVGRSVRDIRLDTAVQVEVPRAH